VTLSPQGPAPANITVTIGARAAATLDASGTANISPPTDVTSTILVTDDITHTLILMAVVPKGTANRTDRRSAGSGSSDAQVNPLTTIQGLIFFHLGGYLLPQDEQNRFFDMLSTDPKVATVISLFGSAYVTDPHALSHLTSDPVLSVAFKAALESAANDLASSQLLLDIEQQIGVPSGRSQHVARGFLLADSNSGPTASLDSPTVSLAITGSSLTATNKEPIYRLAVMTTADGNIYRKLLPDSGTTVALDPVPLPIQSPIDLRITGGLNQFNPVANADYNHLMPIGLTATFHVVLPLVSCITGLNNIGARPELEPSTGFIKDPFERELFKILVFDPGTAIKDINSLSAPVPKLIVSIVLAEATGQHVDVVKSLLEFGKNVFSAIRDDDTMLFPLLANELGDKVLVAQLIAALGAPELVGLLKAVTVATTLSDEILPTTWAWANTDVDMAFTILGSGDLGVIVRSIGPAASHKGVPADKGNKR
jgi:hypothetical protein